MEKQQKEETSKIVWENEGVDVRGEQYMTSRHGAPMNVNVEQKSPLVKDESEEVTAKKEKILSLIKEKNSKVIWEDEGVDIHGEKYMASGHGSGMNVSVRNEGETKSAEERKKEVRKFIKNYPDLEKIPDPENKEYALKAGNKVVIVGGGYAGAVAALNLKKLNSEIDVTIIERRSGGEHCASGPKTCKGCMGWIAASAVDQLGKIGIEIPSENIVGDIEKVELRNLNNPDGDASTPLPPAKDRKGVLIANGNGPAGLLHGKNISFPQFLRDEAITRGIKFEEGVATNIFIPKSAKQSAFVRAEAFDKKDDNGVVLPADLVINASGVNDPNIIEISEYEKNEEGIKEKSVSNSGETHNSGIFELELTTEEIAKMGLDPKTFYTWYGMKNTEAVLAAIKSAEGKNWMTIIISPRPDMSPKDQETKTTQKMLEEMYFEFLGESGFSKVIGEKRSRCRCVPKVPINIAEDFSRERYITLGDTSGAMKYKKNGIGYLIEMAKTVAETAADKGVTGKAFEKELGSRYKGIERDNYLGKTLFAATAETNQFKATSKVYEMGVKNFAAVRQFGARLILGNTEFETTYAGNLLKTIKDLFKGKKAEQFSTDKNKKHEVGFFEFLEARNKMIQESDWMVWNLEKPKEPEKKDKKQESRFEPMP